MAKSKPKEFDLRPDPRILRMLGEINLAQWRCLAELIDNSVDSFLAAQRAGRAIVSPEVHVSIPTGDKASGQVTIVDNGPGMSAEGLESAVRAGWSGNNSSDSLGMFGMGFNIATARLGSSTTVWTTQAGDPDWVGVTIDFDVLTEQRTFHTPQQRRKKEDVSEHGTQVTIEKLKAEQRLWFTKPGNRAKLNNELRRVYSAMLRTGGSPIHFRLRVKGEALEGHRHCVWSGPGNVARTVASAAFGLVDAFQEINVSQGPRPYCARCWQWLADHHTSCPFCVGGGAVFKRQRAIRGWIGIQRYLSETDYGIDFLRNGRKIEIANKELFSWVDGERTVPEYPVDDPRYRGRIVGEIHLDHCRVTYTKDRFERSDPAWDDMVRALRGDGPLRPDKAEEAGFGPNDSPLFKLFQLFRRSTPKSKTAGAYRRLLVVPDNTRATEMAQRFRNGEAAYQTDSAWWALIEEADGELLTGSGSSVAPTEPVIDIPAGFIDPPTTPVVAPLPGSGAVSIVTPTAAPPLLAIGKPIAMLTRLYLSDVTDQRWDVVAFSATEAHPMLVGRRPWVLRAQTEGNHIFMVDPTHEVFASATMTPLDALLAELAWSAMDFLRSNPGEVTFAQVLASLRQRYATAYALDPTTLAAEARSTLREIARTLANNIEPSDAPALFEQLSPDAREDTFKRMATQGAGSAKAIISAGRFLEYAPTSALLDFFSRHPELFLDGRCWDDPYESLNFDLPAATNMARERVVRHFVGLLTDAAWLAEQDTIELNRASRARLLRAMHALDMLEPTVEDSLP